MSAAVITQKRASSIKVGDMLDAKPEPAKVLEVGCDPYNRSAIVLHVEVCGHRITVGAFKPGQLVGVVG